MPGRIVKSLFILQEESEAWEGVSCPGVCCSHLYFLRSCPSLKELMV